jgi:hypothetical protein
LRFRWQVTGSALVLHIREYVSGTWNLDGGTVTHRQRDRRGLDEQVSRGYQITAGQNAVGNPATVLKFDQHVIRGASSDRFALERELATNERDPACSPGARPGVA